ncbi:MAG: ABC transporter permease [Clostridia bacterium]|nr:ABC transporter permease [Clostridia bacterium]
MENTVKKSALSIGRFLHRIVSNKAVIAIAVILIGMWMYGWNNNSNFFRINNIINIFRASSINLIIAFGVTFAVICRGCDLSVGAVMSLSGIVAIQLMNSGMDMGLAILLAILSGTVVGFINGFLVVHQKTEAFIITLGMGMLVKGVAQQLTNAMPISCRNPEFMKISNSKVSFGSNGEVFFENIFGPNQRSLKETLASNDSELLFSIPYVILFMLALGVITFVLLRYTSFGRNCYALGGDYEVAKYSGISVVRTKWTAFVITGTMAAIAGVLLSSEMNAGSNIYGDEIPLLVNCSVVIGGTSFAGGIGGIPQSFAGVMVMGLLHNSMNMLKIPPYIKQLFIGMIIVAIICLDCYTTKRKKMDV